MPCNINCSFNLRYLDPLQGRYICISSLLMLFNQITQNVRATVSTDLMVYKGLTFNYMYTEGVFHPVKKAWTEASCYLKGRSGLQSLF